MSTHNIQTALIGMLVALELYHLRMHFEIERKLAALITTLRLEGIHVRHTNQKSD